MSLVKCRCGKSSTNFVKLGPKDLPNGYEEVCCKKVPRLEVPSVEALEVPESNERAEEVEGQKLRRGPKPKKIEEAT